MNGGWWRLSDSGRIRAMEVNHAATLAKTVERLVDVHFAQVNSYLRFSGLELGLLLNFRTWPLEDGESKRVIRSYT